MSISLKNFINSLSFSSTGSIRTGKFAGHYVCFLCILIVNAVLLSSVSERVFAQISSEIIYFEDNRLKYVSDEEGNRIPDFSHAGYRGGGIQIPDVPVRITLNPAPGDDTARIQKAIDDVSAMGKNQQGIRGAVKLNPGVYHISDNLFIRESGVVLRGGGDGINSDSNTIIRASRRIQGTVLQIGNELVNWNRSVSSSANIITEFVAVGSRSFDVDNPSLFKIGDNIIISHPGTKEWLTAINYGGTHGNNPWQPGFRNITYNRYITNISGNTISIDAPVYNHLDKDLSESRVYKLDRTNIVTEVGVEKLRIEIQTDHPLAENHADNGIFFRGVENGWATEISVLHFKFTGIGTHTSSNITISNSKALEPHSRITTGRRYNFNAGLFSNNILFEGLTASNGRHCFVVNGTSSASGIVFHNSTSIDAISTSEGHQRWSQALLFDNITFVNPLHHTVLGLFNRGNLGTGHGWSAVHSVAWNVDSANQRIIIQKPPTAQNYGIGNRGRVSGNGIFIEPAGFIAGTNEAPQPASLYLAQLAERLDFGVPPDAPSTLTVSNQTNNILILNWKHVSVDPVDFSVYRAPADSGRFERIAVIQDGSTSYIDSNISDQSYKYRIRASNQNGMSAYSSPVEMNPRFGKSLTSDFWLSAPKDGTTKIIDGEQKGYLTFNWQEIEGDADLRYTWFLDRADADFSDALFVVELLNKAEVSLSIEEINNMMIRENIQYGESLPVKWAVKAQSSSMDEWSQKTHYFTFHREFIPENHTARLDQNYPNPFNPSTVIRYHLSERSSVSVDVYDLHGAKVASLENRISEAGTHIINFDAGNLASGVYFYRLIAGNQVQTRKMILIK